MSEFPPLFSNTLDFDKTQVLNRDSHLWMCWSFLEAGWAHQCYLQVTVLLWELDEKSNSYSVSDFVLWEIEAAKTE